MEVGLRQELGGSTAMVRALAGYLVLELTLVSLVLWWLLSRHVVRPLRSVTDEIATAAARVSQGCYDPLTLYADGQSEVGQLTAALARLLGSIDHERRQLQAEVRLKEEANRQVRRAHQEIARSERLATVGRLASGIAHEIGNPVGIMQGYVHMLQRRAAGDARSNDMLQRLAAELDRVAGTVRELLEFAQPGAQKVEPVPLNPLVAQVWQMLACQTVCQSVTPVFELAAALPPVAGNSVQLRQVLLNLLLNAAQAMPAGGSLRVRTRTGEDDGHPCVLLEVQDSGIGIAADALASVFEPFYTTKESGCGLGLANVQRIVTAMGGTIAAASTPGAGATFSVRLPVYDPTTEAAQ